MESLSGFNSFEFDGCGCCHSGSKAGEENSGCTARDSIFTLREQDVLHRIRESSERARELKRRIGSKGAGESQLESAGRELENLRTQRILLEKERIAAAEERMRMLGHL